MIYIREAHPMDGWWFGRGLGKFFVQRTKAATHIRDPQDIEERRTVAKECDVALKYQIPTYVDEMHDPVSKTYAAKPTRLYLIGIDGTVKYAGGLGPYGFKPQELGKAIQDYLGELETA